MDERSRRSILRATSACCAAGLAGCAGVFSGGGSSSGETATATNGSAETPSRGDLRSRLQDLQRRFSRINEALDVKTERIAALEGNLTRARERLAARNETVASLESTVADRDARIAELETHVEELEAEVERFEDRVDELEARTPAPEGSGTFSDDVLQEAKATALEARRSVVKIVFERGHGTGWVIDADAGHIVTNAHVVRNRPSPTVETLDGSTVEGERVDYDDDLAPDVGLVRADVDVPAIPTGDSSALASDDPLLTVGHPAIAGDWVATIGRYERTNETFGWVLSTVPTDNGNSGGPLLTLGGDAVGLVSGTTPSEDIDRSRSDEVYAEMPEPPDFATATPVETVVDLVSEWT